MLGMTQNIAKKHIRPKEGFFKRTFGPLLQAFREGDAWTRLSAIIMGLGNLRRGQIIKGLLMLAFEVGFFLFHIFFGWQYLKDFGTLGTVSQRRVWDEAVQIYRRVPGDNSMLILLFSVLTLATIIPFVLIWAANMKSALKVQKQAEAGMKPNTFIQDLKTLLDERFHITLLTMPMISLAAFTVLPIIFMVLIAFTNFDKMHQPPGSLFTWVGMTNVTDVFWGDALKSRTFFGILGWTLIWAVFATFTRV